MRLSRCKNLLTKRNIKDGTSITVPVAKEDKVFTGTFKQLVKNDGMYYIEMIIGEKKGYIGVTRADCMFINDLDVEDGVYSINVMRKIRGEL